MSSTRQPGSGGHHALRRTHSQGVEGRVSVSRPVATFTANQNTYYYGSRCVVSRTRVLVAPNLRDSVPSLGPVYASPHPHREPLDGVGQREGRVYLGLARTVPYVHVSPMRPA